MRPNYFFITNLKFITKFSGMNFLKSCFFLLTCLVITGKISAQIKNTGLPQIKNYKRSEYSGDTQNWGIDQDSNDNLYFANNAGLLQFDGSAWSKFNLPNHPSVRSLKIGDSNKIYIGGYNEFGYFKADEKGKLKYRSLLPLLNESNRKQIDFVWKIHQFKNEIIFQSFERAYIYDGKKIRQLEAPDRFQFSFTVMNRLYFQDISSGLLEFKNNLLVPVQGTAGLNATEVWGIFALREDKLLIATQNKGIFIYTNDTLLPWNTDAGFFLKQNGCLGGVSIKDNFIVFNSVLDGIIISDSAGKIVQHIHQHNGLQNNTVLTSIIDHKDNLWLGLDNGIDFINESSPLTYFGPGYNISTVYASIVYKENLYVATNRGLFYKPWNKPDNKNSFTLIEGTTGQAWNIQVIDEELFCAHNRGLLLIAGGKVIKSLDAKGYWGVKKIPNQPNLFIASQYNGFAVFEKKQQRWAFKNYVEGLNKSASTFEIEGENVWLIKDDLLYQLKLNADFTRFKSVKTNQNLSDSVKGISGIHFLNNKVYFQSGNHFYLFLQQLDLFKEDKKITDVFKDLPTIRFLYQDADRNIWYVYEKSLGVLKKTENDGFQNIAAPFSNLKGNLVLDYLSVNVVDPQNIFIGMTDGLAHVNSAVINNALSIPKAYVRSISFTGDTIFFANSGSKSTVEYKIPYKSNNVKFTFSSPMYENAGNIEFSCRLEGFNNEWSDWTTLNIKEYTNLQEGDYKMNVKVRNSFGVSSEPDSVSFVIAPPFYRHTLAYLFYLAAAVFSFFILRQRIKIKIRKNKYYEKIEQRKLYLEKEAKIKLEQSELEKEIEKLKVEKLKIELLSKDKELVNNSFAAAKKNKVLNGIIQKIKTINNDSVDESTRNQLNKLNKSLIKELDADKSWTDLEKHIKNVHFDFLKRLKDRYPGISSRELDLSTYLLLNMSSKEIAEIMNISIAGVELARYRLRKKMGLSREENLVSFLMSV
jgi:DNA-binding CsgD family transcriptional regulator